MSLELVSAFIPDFPYEDEYVVVFDKPAGVQTQGASEKSLWDAQGMVSFLKKQPCLAAHRLDPEASGVLLLAKSPDTRALLMEQFAQEQVEKAYIVIVEGICRPKSLGEVNLFQVADYFGRVASIIELQTRPGTAEDLRAHFADLGHPVIGDPLYNPHSKGSRRMLLHASAIDFIHPITQEKIPVSTVIPEDFFLPSLNH